MIRDLIAQGDTETALENLSNYFNYFEELQKELIGLKNRYATLKSEIDQGIVEDRDKDIRTNRINQALLGFYEQIEHELGGLFESNQRSISQESFQDRVSFKLLRQYRIVSQIAEGNTAIIYKASDIYSRQFVAIRALKKQDFSKSTMDTQSYMMPDSHDFMDKLYSIRHRNIIRIIGTYLGDFPECMVLEYINSGTSLNKILQLGPRPLYETIYHVTKIGHALNYLHSKGLIHGKIQPSKILIDLEHQPMISPLELFSKSFDHYGLHKLLDDLVYDSPEELDRNDPHEKSDQFSLGLVAYELLYGKPLFSGDTLNALVESRNNFANNKTYRKKIIKAIPAPRSIQLTIDKMLAYNPNERFTSLRDAMKSFHEASSYIKPHSQLARESYMRSCRRNDQLIKDFYNKLFELHPHMQPYFNNPKLTPKRRMRLVRSAIPLMLSSDQNQHFLKVLLGNQSHRDLDPTYYEQFIDTIILTVADNDYLWNDQIHEAWQEVKTHVMSHVAS